MDGLDLLFSPRALDHTGRCVQGMYGQHMGQPVASTN